MQKTIDETNRRREKQIRYNEEHHIVPQALQKKGQTPIMKSYDEIGKKEEVTVMKAAEEEVAYGDPEILKKRAGKLRKAMEEAARKLEFMEAAKLRDELFAVEDRLKKMEENK